VLVSGASQAHVIGLNIVQTPKKSQIKQQITEPKATKEIINTTTFKGDELFAKKAAITAPPVDYLANIEPIEHLKTDVAPEKPMPTEPSPATENATSSISSASKVTDKIGLRDTPLVLDNPPLFKQPRPPLDYPNKARRRGYQGITLLMISLDTSGAIEKVVLVKSSGYQILDKAALKNVARWQFHPVQHNGENVKARFKVPINFALNS
jgi:protein TonB